MPPHAACVFSSSRSSASNPLATSLNTFLRRCTIRTGRYNSGASYVKARKGSYIIRQEEAMSDGFKFDLTAKRIRLSDEHLVNALQAAAEAFGASYFTTTQYDGLTGKRPHSATIVDRFGSWKKALALIGISGGREREHSAEQLIENLEAIWKELGVPPGKRQIRTFGEKISESPYKRHWGSVRSACEALAAFHSGRISREKLLAGNAIAFRRTTIPLKDRWTVLKRDKYSWAVCGASPSNDHQVELEVDHIRPVSKGGGNELENLQTLCRRCDQGKKDR